MGGSAEVSTLVQVGISGVVCSSEKLHGDLCSDVTDCGVFAGVFLCGYYALRLDMPHLQTLTFVTLILSSQAGVYLLRERGHFWRSQPSGFLVASSVLGLTVAALLVVGGILMPPLSGSLLVGLAGLGIIYFASLDWVKVWLFRRLNLR
jgi:H+-transporting ATPase